MQKINGPMIETLFQKDLLERIDHVAKRTGNTRSQTIRSLCDVGCLVFSGYETFGVVKLNDMYESLKKKLKNDVAPALFDME